MKVEEILGLAIQLAGLIVSVIALKPRKEKPKMRKKHRKR